MRIRVTRDALSDLDDIFAYIAQDSPSATAEAVRQIRNAFGRLEDFPESGEKADVEGLRRLSVRNYPYIVFYEISAQDVIIHHVRHGARRPWMGKRPR